MSRELVPSAVDGLGEAVIVEHNLAASRAWNGTAAHYEAFSAHFSDAIEHCVDTVHAGPELRVLDVATGTGRAARLLSATGAEVIGLDFAESLVAVAREIAEKHKRAVRFEVGDAEALPYENASFDRVVSSFGVIFAPGHDRVAAELARVCKPGGRLVMTAWAHDGIMRRLASEVTAPHRPPTVGPPPTPASAFQWGDPAYATRMLGKSFQLQFEQGSTVLEMESGEAVWNLWRIAQPNIRQALNAQTPAQQAAFMEAFIAFHERFREGKRLAMPREYWVIVGTRRDEN